MPCHLWPRGKFPHRLQRDTYNFVEFSMGVLLGKREHHLYMSKIIKVQSKMHYSCVSVAGESRSGLGVVWRQTETHGQEQRPSERRPTHPDGGRPWNGKESDVAGNTLNIFNRAVISGKDESKHSQHCHYVTLKPRFHACLLFEAVIHWSRTRFTV